MAIARERRRVHSSHFYHNLVMVMAGVTLAFGFSTVVFEILNVQFHWFGGGQPASSAPQATHGAAPEISNRPSGQKLIYSAEKTGVEYAVPGQQDVKLLNFTLSPASDGFVHGMTFALDDLAHQYDLKSLKLYLGDSRLGEVTFFEGKGSFQNLMIKLEANKLMEFSVLGTLSDQAQTGDRLLLKIADKQGVDAADGDGRNFEVVNNEQSQGAFISIVSGR